MLPLTDPEAVALLAAVAESPDDDTPRMALADWLEERDYPRAAWVRDHEVWPHMAPAHDPVPGLLEALCGGWERSDWQAREILTKLGPAVIPAIRAWVREDAGTRSALAESILQTAPPELRPVSELIDRMKTAEGYDLWEVITDIGFHGPNAAAAVGPLVEFCERGPDPEHEVAACRALGAIGPAAMAAVPMLLTRFRAEPDGRDGALDGVGDALVKIGPDPEVVFARLLLEEDTDYSELLHAMRRLDPSGTGYLVRAVREGGGQLSYAATGILGNLGAEAADAVPALIDILRRSSPGDITRIGIAQALMRMGEPARAAVPALRAVLAEEVADPPRFGSSGESVSYALVRLGEPVALATFLPGLQDEAYGVRQTAILKLERLAGDTRDAFPHLFAMLRDPVAAVRETAAGAIANLVTNSSDAGVFAPPLLAALDDSDAQVRHHAVRAMGTMKARQPGKAMQLLGLTPAAPDVDGYDRGGAEIEARILEALIRAAAHDEAANVRIHAVEALGSWGELPPEAAPALLEFIRRDDGHWIALALGVLRVVRPLPADVVPACIALFSRGGDVANAAADVLTSAREVAVPALVEALQSEDDAVIGLAIRSLHDMGEAAAPAAPHLVRLFAGRDPERRRFVVEVLRQLGPREDTPAVFRAALADPDAKVRSEAALAAYVTRDRTMIPELLASVADEDEGVRYSALNALENLKPDPALALPLYRAALADSSSLNRGKALECLGSLGAAAKVALPDVLARCRHPEAGFRMRAIQAACKIADDPARVVPAVRDLLDDPDKSVRWFASEGFRDMGATARAIAPDLFARCPVRVSPSLILSMKQFRDRLDTFIPQVRPCLGDEDEGARRSTAMVLRALGPEGETALREALADPDERVREAARYGLDAVIE